MDEIDHLLEEASPLLLAMEAMAGKTPSHMVAVLNQALFGEPCPIVLTKEEMIAEITSFVKDKHVMQEDILDHIAGKGRRLLVGGDPAIVRILDEMEHNGVLYGETVTSRRYSLV